ncbi:30S ribosomal protein S5 [Candidatus Woesearchaeota archaeon]|nr:30S ribosomal protein S5 [Candidatus Woesearchaeota archaeon]
MREEIQKAFDVTSWQPKTELGRKVKSGEIKDIDEILGHGRRILETEIIDALLKTESELLLIGQAKGKFGGGQRRVFRQTQKKTREGNRPKFATFAVAGDGNGHVGVGYGKSKETVPAREKAFRQAKLNMMMIRRGTGSWEDQSTEPHSIPFAVEGKCGSYKIILKPAPKGKGLICDKEVAKILKAAGIQNVWSKSFGQKKNKINVIKATMQALRKLSQMSVQPKQRDVLAVSEGSYGPIQKPLLVEEKEPVVSAEEKATASVTDELQKTTEPVKNAKTTTKIAAKEEKSDSHKAKKQEASKNE